MSRGRTTSGDATGGQDRPKSGEFEALASPKGGSGLAVKVSTPPAGDDSSDIDSDWEAPDSKRSMPSVAKVAPRPVISIGPPALEPENAPVALLNKRSSPPEAVDGSRAPSVPAGSLAAPKAVNPEELKKLLTDGPENEFSALDIGTLVSNVMGSQPPPANPPSQAPAAQIASRAPAAANAEDVLEPNSWDLPERSIAAEAKPLVDAKRAIPPTNSQGQPRLSTDKQPGQRSGKSGAAASSASAVLPSKSRPSTSKAKNATSADAPPSSKGRKRRKKQQITAARKSAAPAATQIPSDHAELEWAGEFFSGNPNAIAHTGTYHESDDLMLDERHLRSLSPEVRARRSRYRVWVLFLVIGLLVLLGAAIALRVLGHH